MPQPALTTCAPVLLVRDVLASAAYYRESLGFAFDRFWGEPASFVILYRDSVRLMLQQVPAHVAIVPHWKVSPQMWNAYFWVTNVDDLYADFKARGAKIDYELHDKPYLVREFGIQDLDGYDIAFGEPIASGT